MGHLKKTKIRGFSFLLEKLRLLGRYRIGHMVPDTHCYSMNTDFPPGSADFSLGDHTVTTVGFAGHILYLWHIILISQSFKNGSGSYKTCHRPDMAYGLQFADPVNIFFITMTKRKPLCKDHLKVILNLSTYFFIYYHKTHQYT